MSNTAKVPWTNLFPGLDSRRVMTDSTKRKHHRHYRVKLPFKHKHLAAVQAKLEPYGFVCETWHAGFVSWGPFEISRDFEYIKCIRQTPL